MYNTRLDVSRPRRVRLSLSLSPSATLQVGLGGMGGGETYRYTAAVAYTENNRDAKKCNNKVDSVRCAH